MPGLTAFSSFYEILGDTSTLKKGNVILISAASGAVGQIVGQIAKKEGLVVIGSVGDDKKLDYIIKELGFDAGFNYKKEKPADGLKRCAPNGIDIYYENVGGEHLEAALDAMNNHGKISMFLHSPLSLQVVNSGPGCSLFLIPTDFILMYWSSRLRHDKPIQPLSRRPLPDPQPDASRCQAHHHARLHRPRPGLWRQAHGRASREGSAVDHRRQHEDGD